MKAKSNGHRVYAGKAAELSGGFVRQVKFGTKTILVTRVGGTIVAYDGQCRHMKAPLATAGRRQGDTLICTWHGWSYDLATGAAMGKSSVCLPAYLVELTVDGEVWVILDGGDGQDFH